MAAINSVVAREALVQLAKRKNFASKNPGVILVFCIVFIVAVGLLALWLHKFLARRRAARAAHVV
ncbi:unnamed protein product [Parascedosporium putredinis]|uniref:Uncharacterized protein n=1 Tax=Parascedosporium putredinis TaxID=1442378 RepID=A0A9P1H487_9PEZI|nr:unnamed protein product [Parascedosporium putredinis]CAI7995394.1 unnamed protein product [Parascedosporium putredinis]